MKIFNAQQIRQWDVVTTETEGINPSILMQRAGRSCTAWIRRHYPSNVPICIVCGKGGNGGDGLVITHGLLQSGYTVSLILIHDPKTFKGATLEQWNILQQLVEQNSKIQIQIINQGEAAPELCDIQAIFERTQAQLIIDAVLGTGFTPKNATSHQQGATSRVIQAMNQYAKSGRKRSKRKVVAIDLPSGLPADALPDAARQQPIVQADDTLSFQSYKRSFLHVEAAIFVGKIHKLDIGLSQVFYKSEPSLIHTVDRKAALKRYTPRPMQSFEHKGSFGTVVLVGGSYGKIGAIALSAKASLRSGAGKVFVQAPKCGYEILQTFIPEAMFEPAGSGYIEKVNLVKKATYGIGPGMDTHPESASALLDLLSQLKDPVVLDADALNILAANQSVNLSQIPKNSILTPHPGEFNRLFGKEENSLTRVDKASAYAQKWQLIIVLKGHHTATCTPDGKIYYNLSGNAAMATAGSGDVLTGIITALLAQGYSPKNAAIFGVYLHGLSGDIYAKKRSPESLIAHDLIENLPSAFRKLARLKSK